MALKSKLTKTEYEALPDAIKEHYKASGDNFVLDTDDASELRTALEKARTDKADAEARAAAAQKRIDDAAAEAQRIKDEKARNDKDVTALEKSWQDKLDAEKTTSKTKTDRLQTQLNKLLVDNVAQAMAAEISTAPALILPHIKSRLRAELDGENAVTRVLDEAGNLSAKNLAELKAELIAKPEFAAIIKGTNANGGGAANSGNGSGASDKDFSKLTQAERTEWARRDPAGFRQASEAHKAAQAA